MDTKTVIQKPEIKDNSEYKINRRTREGKLLFSLLNKEQVKSAKLVKVIKPVSDGRIHETNGVYVQWETPLVISMARDINNHPNHTDKDVVNVVVTEMIQTEFADKPEFIVYTTVGDEPQVFTMDGRDYNKTDLEREALRRAMASDQVEELRLGWLSLERVREHQHEHQTKLEEAKANAKISEHDSYMVRRSHQNLEKLEKILAQPLEITPKELIKRAKFLLTKQLFELVVNNVGQPYCKKTFYSNDYGSDRYRIMTVNDVMAYITTQWKSTDWGYENDLDQAVIKEFIQEIR
jgi:hypothetical protein